MSLHVYPRSCTDILISFAAASKYLTTKSNREYWTFINGHSIAQTPLAPNTPCLKISSASVRYNHPLALFAHRILLSPVFTMSGARVHASHNYQRERGASHLVSSCPPTLGTHSSSSQYFSSLISCEAHRNVHTSPGNNCRLPPV